MAMASDRQTASNLPRAIRKDHSPLALVGVFGMVLERALIFLGFVRWTSYQCPYCNAVFRRDFWPDKLRLGSGKRTCQRCGRLFDDGSREWPQLTLTQKLRFFFPPLFLGIWGGLVLAALLAALIGPPDEHTLPIVAVFILVPTFLWSPVRLIWMLLSYHRCRRMARP
jgi:uncharacterized Zn-finger protein